jgi:hypothetical protein
MNEQLLQEMIDEWEPENAVLVRMIDTDEDTVERVIKDESDYAIYRYFTMRAVGSECVKVSVDHQGVDADFIIQTLAERL